jgi:hypothetical protein
MAVDQAGQHEVAANIQDRDGIGSKRRFALADSDNTARFDPDIYQPPVGESAIYQMRIEPHVASPKIGPSLPGMTAIQRNWNWLRNASKHNPAGGIERPAYGFFLDNTTDILEYAVFAAGIGLSGYVRWELVLGALAPFYMMMLLGLIKSRVMNGIVTGRVSAGAGGSGRIGDDPTFLSPTSLSTTGHPTRDLAVSPVHAQLTGR